MLWPATNPTVNETAVVTRPALMKLWFNTHRPMRVVPVESN